MDAAQAELVRRRAGNRCEYCQLPQEHSVLQFHIEHIIARQHGGAQQPGNLALACPECNWFKGTNIASIDPDTGDLVRLFDPRSDAWDTHFRKEGALIRGTTAMGRTTAWLLQFNTGDRLRWREFLLRSGLLG